MFNSNEMPEHARGNDQDHDRNQDRKIKFNLPEFHFPDFHLPDIFHKKHNPYDPNTHCHEFNIFNKIIELLKSLFRNGHLNWDNKTVRELKSVLDGNVDQKTSNDIMNQLQTLSKGNQLNQLNQFKPDAGHVNNKSRNLLDNFPLIDITDSDDYISTNNYCPPTYDPPHRPPHHNPPHHPPQNNCTGCNCGCCRCSKHINAFAYVNIN
jgi:hypothetical protein